MKKAVSVRHIYDSLVNQVGVLNCSIVYECTVDGLKKSRLLADILGGESLFEAETRMLYPHDTLLIQYTASAYLGVRCKILRDVNRG